MSRSRRIAVVLITAILLLVVSPLIMAMTIAEAQKPHPLTAEIENRQDHDDKTNPNADPDKKDPNKTDPDNPDARTPVFGTYSENKVNNDYNFNENMWLKAQAAVDKYPDRYKDVLSYITDPEFDLEAYDKAVAAVKAGEAASVLEYMENHEDAGKISFWSWYDPGFLGAIATAIDLVDFDDDPPILLETTNGTPIPQRPDTALLRFIEDQKAWDETFEKVVSKLLKDPEMARELMETSNYTSAMYMRKDGIVKGIPSVIVRKSSHTGGHFVKFTKNGKELKLRLECGYQPIVVPHWPVPPDPPPVLDSKDPSKDLQNQKGNEHEDYYSQDRVNNNPDTTVTTEPTLPTEEYQNPDPPESEITTTEGGVSDDTKTGSDIIDNTDDTTETITSDDGKTTETVEVVAGDGRDHGNYTEIVDKEPASVEKPMENSTTTGDLDPSKVE